MKVRLLSESATLMGSEVILPTPTLEALDLA
jgi:hypothetical protein